MVHDPYPGGTSREGQKLSIYVGYVSSLQHDYAFVRACFAAFSSISHISMYASKTRTATPMRVWTPNLRYSLPN